MRLVSYRQTEGKDGPWRAGFLIGGSVFDAAAAAASVGLDEDRDWAALRELIAAPSADRERTAEAAASQEAIAVADVELGPPIPDPEKIICLGLNYRDHAEETGLPFPAVPMLFAKFRNSLVGPEADVTLPPQSEAVDYEAELAVVIGSRLKDVAEADALDHVAGLMAFNDLTARDLQHQTSQWTAGKAIDGFGPCGPALVTLDEIADPQALRIGARVNGETVQDGSTANMIFGIAETIAFISGVMTLEPGDVIATGTPAGVGFKRTPPLLLGDGDVVEVEVEGVGELRNKLVASNGSAA
jgi:2-keto-4-pentenoate hydratase/2-oxohepta-3-ene-1,7-dioic acid hydratase in catechol pathway